MAATGTTSDFTNPLESLHGYQLRRASNAIMADLARGLEPLGLRPTEASILLLIDANPGITQSEIGRLLGIKRANMVPLSAALERRGLIRREQMDGRSHGLLTTAEGAATCDAARRIIEDHEQRSFSHFSPDQLASLVAALRAIRA